MRKELIAVVALTFVAAAGAYAVLSSASDDSLDRPLAVETAFRGARFLDAEAAASAGTEGIAGAIPTERETSSQEEAAPLEPASDVEESEALQLAVLDEPQTVPRGIPTEHASGNGSEGETGNEDGVILTIGFDELSSFDYEPPDLLPEDKRATSEDQIPKSIRDMHGKTVEMEGHMIPIQVEDGHVKSFILSRYNNSCCFGMAPRLNEWVMIDMKDDATTEYVPYGTILVTGVLEVGERLDEFGYVSHIYRIMAESVTEP